MFHKKFEDVRAVLLKERRIFMAYKCKDEDVFFRFFRIKVIHQFPNPTIAHSTCVTNVRKNVNLQFQKLKRLVTSMY